MSPEQPKTLGQLANWCKENGVNESREMVERVVRQFGSHVPVSPQALEISRNGLNDGRERANFFRVLTGGHGRP